MTDIPGRLRLWLLFAVSPILALMVLFSVSSVSSADDGSKMLQGSASVSVKSKTRLSRQVQEQEEETPAPVTTTSLIIQNPQTDWTTPTRPTWIPGRVYTTDGMVMETFKISPWSGRKKAWRPPLSGYNNMKLHRGLMSHWRSGWDETYVNVVPFGPAGNFYFFHASPDGPRGYMEYIGEGTNGLPNYRYWFASAGPQ